VAALTGPCPVELELTGIKGSHEIIVFANPVVVGVRHISV
jgi:hypothetical protein